MLNDHRAGGYNGKDPCPSLYIFDVLKHKSSNVGRIALERHFCSRQFNSGAVA